MKPLIMARRGGFPGDNTLESIRNSLKHDAEIVELDIRKSSDDILFCYHGNSLEFLFHRLFFKKSFRKIKEKYGAITLKEAAKAVRSKSILFLDIKDKSITSKDLISCLQRIKVKEVWIASNSFKFHESLKELPKKWRKVFNVGIPKFRRKLISRIVKSKLDVVELFFWDFKSENISLLKKYKIRVALSSAFLSEEKYTKTCFSEKTEWIWGRDLKKLKNYKNSRF